MRASRGGTWSAAAVLAALLTVAGCHSNGHLVTRTAPERLLNLDEATPAVAGRDFAIRSADIAAAALPARIDLSHNWVAWRASTGLVVWRDASLLNGLRRVDFRVHDLRTGRWSRVAVDLRRIVDNLPDPRFDPDQPVMLAHGRLVFVLTDTTAVQAVVLSVGLHTTALQRPRRLAPAASSADLDKGRLVWARGTGRITLVDLDHHRQRVLRPQLPKGCEVKENPDLDLAGQRLLLGVTCSQGDRGLVVGLDGREQARFAETSNARLTDRVLVIRPGRTTYAYSFGNQRLVRLDLRDYSDPGWDGQALTFHAGPSVEELIPR